jgi:hypothetical protein
MVSTRASRHLGCPRPLPVPKGKPPLTLKDAAGYITKLPETEQHHPAALILVAETNGPTMFARIGML